MQILSPTPMLSIYAGKKALEIIRDEGLRPERISVMAGAAGGPKGLVLNGLDRFLMTFFARRTQPLFMIGASIGAWRFVATVLGRAALERFTEAYITQYYHRPPSPDEVTAKSRYILKQLMGKHTPDEVLAHPIYRLSVLAVRGRHLAASRRNPVLSIGMGSAAAANLVKRVLLKYFFERTLFYDSRDVPPYIGLNDLPSQTVALSPANLIPATMASGAIPLLMAGIQDIPGAKKGIYWDGGIVDYHLDIDYLGGNSTRLVLFPHYAARIIPGWLDKSLAWRLPVSVSRDNLVLLTPSRAFVSRLPFGKIPDREDFKRFLGRDGERIAYWRQAVTASAMMAEALSEALDSGSIRQMVRPLP